MFDSLTIARRPTDSATNREMAAAAVDAIRAAAENSDQVKPETLRAELAGLVCGAGG